MATDHTYAGLTSACLAAGPASTASQGMLAEALVALGAATRNPGSLNSAASFINFALRPASGMIGRSVLEESMEGQSDLCANGPRGCVPGADNGLLTDAIADWTRATGSSTMPASWPARHTRL